MASTTDLKGINLSKLQETVKDRGVWSAAVCGVAKSQTWLNNNNIIRSKVKEHGAQSLSLVWLCNLMDCSPPGSSVHANSPGKNTRVGCHALLQGIFLIQGSNSGLSHCRQILYHLSHQGNPRILEWVVYPLSRGSSRPRNQTPGSLAFQANSLPGELPGKTLMLLKFYRRKKKTKTTLLFKGLWQKKL